MEANTIRGEQIITLDTDYVMRPSFSAIQAIEDATGLSLFELAMNAATGKMRGVHVAIIVTELIKADLRHAGKGAQAGHWKVEKVGELLMEHQDGLLGAIKALIPILNDAATGGYTAQGEAKAAAVTAGQDPTADTPAAG